MKLHVSRSLALLGYLAHSSASPTSRFAPRAIVVEDASQLRDEYDYVIIGGGTSGCKSGQANASNLMRQMLRAGSLKWSLPIA
jgi:hypothetical protein